MFARDVNTTLNDPSLVITKDNISGAVEKQRRIMSMNVTASNPDEARKIAEAAARTLSEENAKYFAQLGSEGATVAIFDGPDVFPITPGLREQLDVPLRLGLALLAGLVLAFLFDYFDDSVRGARDLEPLGLRILGEIPRAPRGARRRLQGTRLVQSDVGAESPGPSGR